MAHFTLMYVLGGLPEGAVGQWIEGEVAITPGKFALTADVCRFTAIGEFSLYRVEIAADTRFVAPLFLALLSTIAQPPFTPTGAGLRLEASGDPRVTEGEVARLLDPAVRSAAGDYRLPAVIREDLDRQLTRIAVTRRLQELCGRSPRTEEPRLC